MNRKRTNRLVAILNVVEIISFFIFYFSANYLLSSMMTGATGAKSVYNNFIIDILLNNIKIIVILINGGMGVINIICSVQNRENKKILFWQLVYGLNEFSSAVCLGFFIDNDNFLEWVSRIISIIAIILGIINFIRIRKNRPKVIKILSYLAVIIISVLNLIGILTVYWNVIAVIMQFIYIHFQDKNIDESKSRKIVNIILYYVLQAILVFGFFIMLLYSLIITKVNEIKWKNGLSELYNNITTLQDSTDKDVYIPVEKNYKYGFINENGEEKISCQYDRVTYFNEIEINNSTYYIALAMKNNKFFIISKINDSIELNGVLEKYIQTIYNFENDLIISSFNEDGDYRLAYILSFEFLLQGFTKEEVTLYPQTVETNYTQNITLTEKKSKYYYSNKNYSMIIEKIYDEDNYDEYEDNYDEYEDNYDEYEDNYDEYEDDYDEDEDNYDNKKYKVTVTKSNGEQESSVVYLPGLDERFETLNIFNNCYIEFESEDQTCKGWFDSEGNKITIPNTYIIRDIKDDKAILQLANTEDENELNFLIIDFSGNILLETTALDVYDNMYLVKKDNKMVLIDEDLDVISSEYDKIITNMSIDIFAECSSYFKK